MKQFCFNLKPEFVATLENIFALPKEQSVAPMWMLQPLSWVTKWSLETSLETPLGRQRGKIMKITKMTIFEHLFSMLKADVCGEYELNFCTWINCLTCPLMSKACEVKAGIIKGALWRDNHKWYKTCKVNPFLMPSCGQLVKSRDIILLWRFCTYLMTVFEYIIFLFKRPGVPEKNCEERLLNSPNPMTEIFTFKLEQSRNDIK